MSSWEHVALGDAASIEKGRLQRSVFGADALLCIGASEMEGRDSGRRVPFAGAVECRPSDVVMLWDGERSGFVAVGLSGAAGSTAARLRPNQETDGRFLFHVLRREFRFIQGQRTGTGVPHVPKDLARILRFSRPSLEEQRRIVDVLDMLDDSIVAVDRLIRKLELGMIASGHAAFNRVDTLLSSCTPSDLRRPVDGWTLRPLREWVRSGAPITYGIVQAGPEVDGGVPYIRTGDMSGNALDPEALPCTSPTIAASYARSTVRTGEIVIAIRASVGKVLPVPVGLDGANLTQGTARIAPGRSIHGGFLLRALRHESAQRQIRAAMKGTTFQEITLTALREVLIAAPVDREEQEAIANTIAAWESRIASERAVLTKLWFLRDGLAGDLLTGRVRTVPV